MAGIGYHALGHHAMWDTATLQAGEEATIAFGEHGEDEVYFETDDESECSARPVVFEPIEHPWLPL